MKTPNLILLQGVVQHYDWGGYSYIPQLLGQTPDGQTPQAELWMGAHHRGPAVAALNGSPVRLDEWIAEAPGAILGEDVARRFHDRLPFLFKILDVRKMLSIQAHPTKEAAVAGFQRENELGIPLTARHRNYRDDNHKPEIMVALTDFWLLHGFRSPAAISEVLQRVPEFQVLQPILEQGGIRGLYGYLMELPQSEVDRLLAPLARRLERTNALDRSDPDYWAAQAFRDYTREGHYDRGIFSIYLFNLVNLHPGEGIFQDANVAHAYLEGVNVELMANSDNVFRGGLTPKHVDVSELMQHLRFEGITPEVLKGEERRSHERVFPAPVPDFELSRIDLAPEEQYHLERQRGPAVYIVISGSIDTEIGALERGAVFFSPDGAEVNLTGVADGVVFRAGVPG